MFAFAETMPTRNLESPCQKKLLRRHPHPHPHVRRLRSNILQPRPGTTTKPRTSAQTKRPIAQGYYPMEGCMLVDSSIDETKRDAPYGSLRPVLTQPRIFHTITIDFILASPALLSGLNAITTITCRFSKESHYGTG